LTMRSRISGNRARFFYQPRKTTFKENMKIKETASKSYSPAPAGSHIATCTAVIDLGTQESNFNGEIKRQRKLMLTFELNEEAGLRDDGKRHAISKRYTASLHEKSSLRKDLIAWRGRDFSPEELLGFEVNNVAGKTCMISVAHVEKGGGSTYANIVSIMGAPKGVTNPGASVAVTLSLEPSEFNALTFESLGERMREIIAQSPEYKALGKAAPAGVVAEANEEF
jgi:hypothetical protein